MNSYWPFHANVGTSARPATRKGLLSSGNGYAKKSSRQSPTGILSSAFLNFFADISLEPVPDLIRESKTAFRSESLQLGILEGILHGSGRGKGCRARRRSRPLRGGRYRCADIWRFPGISPPPAHPLFGRMFLRRWDLPGGPAF